MIDADGGYDDRSTASVEQILADEATSHWLRNALSTALIRDPADAALDAIVLHDLLVDRCDHALAAARAASI